MVATATTAVAIRYICDRTQVVFDSASSPKSSGSPLILAIASGVAASQSRHNLRPSDTGKPQVSHRRKFPNAMVVIGLVVSSSAWYSGAIAASSGISTKAGLSASAGTTSRNSARLVLARLGSTG